MKIDWKPEALKAGVDAGIESQKYPRENLTLAEYEEAQTHLRAALDAAVAAQGITQTDLHAVLGYEAGHEAGRAEALEEAALISEENAKNCGALYGDGFPAIECREVARRIRALAKA